MACCKARSACIGLSSERNPFAPLIALSSVFCVKDGKATGEPSQIKSPKCRLITDELGFLEPLTNAS